MCWSMSVSVLMAAGGTAATALAVRRREPAAIPLALGYFTVMEVLQSAGYLVIDECGGSLNQSITLLSYFHIVFQPFFINAFAMELVPRGVQARVRRPVYAACGLSSAVMLLQLYPFSWAGQCLPGEVLCGTPLCLVSGDWHLAWNIPYNNLLGPIEQALGSHFAFPTYLIAAFIVPFIYGAWRFVLLHLLAGPILTMQLTSNPNEWPAIWCLFSIGILLMGASPWLRGHFSITRWRLWPQSWLPSRHPEAGRP